MSRWGDDDEPTVECPYCRAEIHEDSQRCPRCGEYISAEDAAPSARKPWWLILGVIVCLYVVYLWITQGPRE
jgi:predicted nucleic acid-binding Zn ribbon protein